jgi:hypothetical protein
MTSCFINTKRKRKPEWAWLVILLLLLPAYPSHAQFMQLQLIIQNEIAINDTRNLRMGAIPVNFGWVQVSPGDDFSGRFTIQAAENVNVMVSIKAPEYLVKDANNRLPFQVKAGYLNNGTRRAHQANLFNSYTARFPLNKTGKLADRLLPEGGHLEATIFLFGATYAGNVSPGLYEGVITITTEFE